MKKEKKRAKFKVRIYGKYIQDIGSKKSENRKIF